MAKLGSGFELSPIVMVGHINKTKKKPKTENFIVLKLQLLLTWFKHYCAQAFFGLNKWLYIYAYTDGDPHSTCSHCKRGPFPPIDLNTHICKVTLKYPHPPQWLNHESFLNFHDPRSTHFLCIVAELRQTKCPHTK
jgi:hypothetical protein